MTARAPARASAGVGYEGSVARAVAEHCRALIPVLTALEAEAPRLTTWAATLAERLAAGHRLLVAGNGGSAAEAQHLSAELLGRFRGERRPYAAIALHTDSSAITAIGNDYGFAEVFARQVQAHAHPGDVVLLLSTSGASQNLLSAARAAAEARAVSWAITGPAPNPLATVCDEAIALPGAAAGVQEAELVAVHALCLAFDAFEAGRSVATRARTGAGT